MGDSLLYSILPLEATNLGISLPQVGILLSANRLIRLLSNTWASGFYEKLGPRSPFIDATLLGVIATVLYGMGWGFMTLLMARIIWGIGWSALRQGGYQAIWVAGDRVKGRMTGILWGLVRFGSAIGVLCGGYLYDAYGFSAAIGAVIAMAILALPVASGIRWPTTTDPTPRSSLPDQQMVASHVVAPYRIDLQLRNLSRSWLSVLAKPVHRWLLGATFCDLLLNSIVIATTSLFLISKLGEAQSGLILGIGIATITGILHGVR
ncbi:MFS transporter [Chloroflexi bacterium TSY]|nr:MFS transporter [Chloroflexi bacterium TSY]